MKIAIISSTFPPYRGGMGNVAYFHARELSRLGHEVTVFCPKPVGDEMKGEEFEIKYLRPYFRYGNAAYIPQLKKELAGFDIVHLHYPFFGGAEAVHSWKKKNPDSKMVMTYHMDTVGKGWLAWFFKFYKSIYLKRILLSADRVFISTQDYARSGDLKQFIEEDPEKFQVSNLGVDIDRFHPGFAPDELAHKYGLEKNDFVLLFVGGLDRAHYFKGLDNLLRAFAAIGNPNLKLIIVGGGDLRPDYEAQARKLGVEKRVHFAGGVDNEELSDYHRLGDILVFPSIDRSEAYGLVALEAGATAKATIASNLPGVRFVVKDGETGKLVEPKDIEGLEEAIKFFIKNPSIAIKYGENALDRVHKEFNWPVIVEKMVESYKNL